jgi:hypothetical protein
MGKLGRAKKICRFAHAILDVARKEFNLMYTLIVLTALSVGG